jgi:hypothetical protein
VKHHFREASWPEGKIVPYQVKLDDGCIIFAPTDVDGVIRSFAPPSPPLAEEIPDSEELPVSDLPSPPREQTDLQPAANEVPQEEALFPRLKEVVCKSNLDDLGAIFETFRTGAPVLSKMPPHPTRVRGSREDSD